MKLATIQDVIESNIDEPVMATRGTLVKLYKQIQGQNDYGPWTLQNGKLKDATGEIKVVFSNREPINGNWQGKLVEIRCAKGAKGGWTGAKRSVDKQKLDTIQVSDKAEVFLFDAEHQPEPAEPGESAPPKSQSKPSSTAQGASQADLKGSTAAGQQNAPQSTAQAAPAKGKSTADQMAEGISRLTQIANTQYAAARVVHEYLVPLLKERGIQLDPVGTNALMQNLLIQCYYEKVHWNFPVKQFPINKTTPLPSDNDGNDAGSKP